MSCTLSSRNVCPPTSPSDPFACHSKWEVTFQDGGYGAPLKRYGDSNSNFYLEVEDDDEDEVHLSDLSGLQTPADTLRSSSSSSGLSDLDWGTISDDVGTLSSLPALRLGQDSNELWIISHLYEASRQASSSGYLFPVEDIIPSNDDVLVIAPLLHPVTSAPFKSVADYLDLARQLLEAMIFFHENHVTGLTYTLENIGMDCGETPMSSLDWDRSDDSIQYHLKSFASGSCEACSTLHNAKLSDVYSTEPSGFAESAANDLLSLAGTLREMFKDVTELSFALPFFWDISEAAWKGQLDAVEALTRFDVVIGQTPPEVLLQVLIR